MAFEHALRHDSLLARVAAVGFRDVGRCRSIGLGSSARLQLSGHPSKTTFSSGLSGSVVLDLQRATVPDLAPGSTIMLDEHDTRHGTQRR